MRGKGKGRGKKRAVTGSPVASFGRGKNRAATDTGSQSHASGIGRGKRSGRSPRIETLAREFQLEEEAKAKAKSSQSTSKRQIVIVTQYFTLKRNSADAIKNVVESPTDLNLVCDDGVVSVHRIFFISISKFLCDLLLDRDIDDTRSVTLNGVSIDHLNVVRDLIYDGVATVRENDMMNLRGVLKLLGIDDHIMKDITIKDSAGGAIFKPQKLGLGFKLET